MAMEIILSSIYKGYEFESFESELLKFYIIRSRKSMNCSK